MPETDDWGVFVDEVKMFASGSPGTGWWNLYIAGQSPERATCLAMTSQGGHSHIACESRKDAKMLLTTMTSQGINPELVEIATLKASRKEAADIPLATIMVKGQDVKIGDDLWVFDKPHRVTRIEPTRIRWSPAATNGGTPTQTGRRASASPGPAAGLRPWLCRQLRGYCLPGDDRREIGRPTTITLAPSTAKVRRCTSATWPTARRTVAQVACAQASEQAVYIQSRRVQTAGRQADLPRPCRPGCRSRFSGAEPACSARAGGERAGQASARCRAGAAAGAAQKRGR